MTYNDILPLIEKSGSDAWLHNDGLGIFTLKADLNVTIQEKRDESEGEDFSEAWTQRVPDKNAKKVAFDLFYGASFVERHYLIAVDGFRAYVPMPDPSSLVISPSEYHFAKVVDSAGSLDEYISRCGLKVG